MTTIEELKEKIQNAKNHSEIPKLYIVGKINGGKTHFGQAPLMINKEGNIILGMGEVFCGSLKFRGNDLTMAKYTGKHTVSCKRCIDGEIDLDKRNEELLKVLNF